MTPRPSLCREAPHGVIVPAAAKWSILPSTCRARIDRDLDGLTMPRGISHESIDP